MAILLVVVFWVISLLVQTGALYMAAKWTGNETPFKVLFIIALICSFCGLIPAIGSLVSTIVMFILLVKVCRMDFWPDSVLTVLISNGLILVLGLVLTSFAAAAAAGA